MYICGTTQQSFQWWQAFCPLEANLSQLWLVLGEKYYTGGRYFLGTKSICTSEEETVVSSALDPALKGVPEEVLSECGACGPQGSAHCSVHWLEAPSRYLNAIVDVSGPRSVTFHDEGHLNSIVQPDLPLKIASSTPRFILATRLHSLKQPLQTWMELLAPTSPDDTHFPQKSGIPSQLRARECRHAWRWECGSVSR